MCLKAGAGHPTDLCVCPIASRKASLLRGLGFWGATQFDPALHLEPVGIVQQLFDADLTDSSVHQIADIGLIFVEDVDELPLRESPAVDLGENRFDDSGLDLQRGCLSPGKANIVEYIALRNVGWFAHFVTSPLRLLSSRSLCCTALNRVLAVSMSRLSVFRLSFSKQCST